MEKPSRRRGDNLYPVTLETQLGGYSLNLDVPAGVWNPTPNGIHLGNMLAQMSFSGEHVLELGTGCGIHAIIIAGQGAAKMTLTEIDQPILDNARHNLAKHDVTCPAEYVLADWTRVDGGPYDSVVANPPFAKSGKRYRRYFVDTLILDAHKLVQPGGQLFFVHSSMADIPKSIDFMEQNGMSVRIVGETSGPFRDYYFEDPAYIKEMAAIPGCYTIQDGTHYERLIVFEATLP
ncbi:MAG: methyltransferase [Planctomycetes bacterium]|nr:methyltransferase [Planctomycetota bacterium]